MGWINEELSNKELTGSADLKGPSLLYYKRPQISFSSLKHINLSGDNGKCDNSPFFFF